MKIFKWFLSFFEQKTEEYCKALEDFNNGSKERLAKEREEIQRRKEIEEIQRIKKKKV